MRDVRLRRISLRQGDRADVPDLSEHDLACATPACATQELVETFDLIVLGAGSAAREGAERARVEHGASVAIIERERWGGQCPNVACKPTKQYVTAAELLHDVRDVAAVSESRPARRASIWRS